MGQYRALYESEKEFLINSMKRDPGRKILKLFFNIWRVLGMIATISMLFSSIESIKNKKYFEIVTLGVSLLVIYGMFWVFPKFMLKNIDSKLVAVQNDLATIREAELVSVRMHREYRASSGHHRRYRTLYYATIWSEDRSHTYEVLTSPALESMTRGNTVFVLRFTDNETAMVHNEYVLPANFESNPNLIIPT